MRILRSLPALALALSVLGCGNPAPQLSHDPATLSEAQRLSRSNPWKREVIYFVFLDRFANGNKRNDFRILPKNPTGYHGGDLDGLIGKLDYLKGLGITTIWISPVVDNDDGELATSGIWGYHGYWAKDFNKVDEHLGDWNTLRSLTQKAHAKGMKVLLDVVANHAGYEYAPAKDPRFKHLFHQHGNIRNWDDPWWLENGSIFGLPDFAQENAEAKKFLIDTYAMWATRSGVDGFRVDTVKHVPRSFWREWNAAIASKTRSDFLLLGEVLHGDPNVVAPYQRDGFDSLFDFPLYFTFNDVFAKGGSMRKLGERFAQDHMYRDAEMLSPFLDNHDVPRFLSQAGGDLKKLKLALACLLTIRGMPCLYYGTETGMTGAKEPENREDMTWGANPALTQYVRSLVGIRRKSNALSEGRQLEMWQDDEVYAFSRKAGHQEAVVVLNNSTHSQTRRIPLRRESEWKDGTRVADALSKRTLTVSDRHLTVTIPAKGALILQ